MRDRNVFHFSDEKRFHKKNQDLARRFRARIESLSGGVAENELH